MKKQFTFFLITFFLIPLGVLHAQAEDDQVVRSLIVTEINSSGGWLTAYGEITNVGDEPVNLKRFKCIRFHYGEQFQLGENGNIIPPKDLNTRGVPMDNYGRIDSILNPGESLLMLTVYDRKLGGWSPGDRFHYWQHVKNPVLFLPMADFIVHTDEPNFEPEYFIYAPQWEMWGFDSIDHQLDFAPALPLSINAAFTIWYQKDNGTWVLVDQYGLNIDWSTGRIRNDVGLEIAGVAQANFDHTLIRKYSVKQGNPDWDDSRGVDASDSEWMLIPRYDNANQVPWTTVKTHGNYSIEMSSETFIFDEGAGTVTIPWGTYKHDSIAHYIDFGPGMAWYYQEQASFSDSAYSTCRTGDLLTIYAAGNTLEKRTYNVIVSEPSSDETRVFPNRIPIFAPLNNPDSLKTRYLNPPNARRSNRVTPESYYYVYSAAEMDTIFRIPYGEPVDTLLKYLEMAPDVKTEIITVDGVDRIDLKRGDVLRVTAANGTTVQDYYLYVEKQFLSSNAILTAITWPDMPEDFYMPGWKGDTIPNFSPNASSFVVTLPYGSTEVPALRAIPGNQNTKIDVVQRAYNLSGGIIERTTVFKTTAEVDSITRTYSVRFEVEPVPEDIQEFSADPFFSKIASEIRAWSGYIELTNPGTTDLDLSRYMVANFSAGESPLDVLTNRLGNWEGVFVQRYRRYIPGYKWTGDFSAWQMQPGVAEVDMAVTPIVRPGESFVMFAFHTDPTQDQLIGEQINYDVNFTSGAHPGQECTWGVEEGETIRHLSTVVSTAVRWGGGAYLFKIKNDSILDGTKPLGDPEDFELIDAFGYGGNTTDVKMAGTDVRQPNITFVRKPDIYKGNLDPKHSFETDEDSDDVEWIVIDQSQISAYQMCGLAGVHSLAPITGYKSTISSVVYLVSDGYVSPQSLQGDMTGTNVTTLFGNLIKADEAQTLQVISGADGTPKENDDPIAYGDTLVVTSANGENVTKYVIDTTPLSSDALLVAKQGSGLSVAVNGDVGTISGMDYGLSLKALLPELIKPDFSTMNIIDNMNRHVPLQMIVMDTVLFNVVAENIYFEVIAQDGTTITYQLQPNSLSSDAFVTSGRYEVNQEMKTISLVPHGLFPSTFLMNIIPAKGAKVTVADRAGRERTDTRLLISDILIVESEDGTNTVVYSINLFGLNARDYNMAPTVEMAFNDTIVPMNEPVNLYAMVEDDGVPYPPRLTYSWQVIDGSVDNVYIADKDQVSTDVTFLKEGYYVLQLSVSDGWITSTDFVAVTVQNTVGVKEMLKPNILVYPNPAKETLTLEVQNHSHSSMIVKVIDLTGRVVFVEKSEENTMVLNVKRLHAGLYFLSVESDDFTDIRKILIAK